MLKMNALRVRVIIVVALASVGLSLLFYFASSWAIERGFSKIEIAQAQDHFFRTQQYFGAKKDYLESKLSDWAHWDDTYVYVSNRNKAYEKSNLNESLVPLKMDMMSIMSLDRKSIWSSWINFRSQEGDKLEPLSDEDIAAIARHESLFSAQELRDVKFDYVQVSRGLMLVMAYPLSNSTSDAPMRGFVLGGLLIDEAFFKDMSEQLLLKVQESEVVGLAQLAKGRLKIPGNGFLDFLSDDEVRISTSIENSLAEVVLSYEILAKRDIYHESQQTISSFLIGMLLLGCLIAVVMFYLTEKLIVQRVGQLSATMNEIANKGDLSLRAPDMGSDEIGSLGQHLNQMMSELVRLRASSESNEKMASIGELAGGIAHEINNPLTIISFAAGVIRKQIQKNETDPQSFLKQLDDIDKTIQRITKIISGLKNLTRDTSQEGLSYCTLSDVVGDSLAICTEKFKTHGIRIKADLKTEGFTSELKCYRVQLSQVFFNLLGNAFDAIESHESPWVEILAEKRGEQIEVRFRDSGHGIPKEIKEKIFLPFFTTKPVGKGTGLGLSLSLAIIQRHQGQFLIDEQDSHTCFVIRLPLNAGVKT